MCAVQLKNRFADARVLAVPTGVLDEQEREQKWQLYQSVGLFIVNVASLFVPVLGGVMLAVAVGQMLGEVYEGVDDWAHGDVDHAREHMLNVALDIATTAATVAGGVALKKASSRLSEATQAFFEDFEPISREDGTARLWNKQVEHYAYTGAAERPLGRRLRLAPVIERPSRNAVVFKAGAPVGGPVLQLAVALHPVG